MITAINNRCPHCKSDLTSKEDGCGIVELGVASLKYEMEFKKGYFDYVNPKEPEVLEYDDIMYFCNDCRGVLKPDVDFNLNT